MDFEQNQPLPPTDSGHAGNTFWHKKFGATVGAIAITILEVLQIIIISAAIIIPIRYFLIQPFYVKGASMEPNYHDNEYLIINEIAYRVREPARGEIVVFRYPRNPKEFFIKRVIGLPGETVEITDNHVVIYNKDYPNGQVLTESYIPETLTYGQRKVTLAPEEYFVMGDNRSESLDSRVFGPLPRRNIVGRVWVRGLPLSRAEVFDLPSYNL